MRKVFVILLVFLGNCGIAAAPQEPEVERAKLFFSEQYGVGAEWFETIDIVQAKPALVEDTCGWEVCGCLVGRTVVISTECNYSETLCHELGHRGLLAATGDYDYNHENTKVFQTFVYTECVQ